MLTTRRYEYLSTDAIRSHHELTNHRTLNTAKVAHLEKDIVQNGLLEPLVVWERTPSEYYLVGGFHRMAAVAAIRAKNPGYFEKIDVRVVAGDPDEIRALNLKLNADRVDMKVTDYFTTVLYLNNAGWPKERMAEFFDKSISWIDDILRFAPMLTAPLLEKLASGELSWNRAKEIVTASLKAPVGNEKDVIDAALKTGRPTKPLTFKKVLGAFSNELKHDKKRTYSLTTEDLYSFVTVLQGKNLDQEHVSRIKMIFPGLIEEPKS